MADETSPREAARDTDDALRGLVAEYQEALRRADESTLLRLFHPTATVSYPDGSTLVQMTARDFVDDVARMVAAGQVVDERTRAIEIHAAGDVAVVRVDFRLQLGDERFEGTDFYTLARLAGAWRITQKLYEMGSPGG